MPWLDFAPVDFSVSSTERDQAEIERIRAEHWVTVHREVWTGSDPSKCGVSGLAPVAGPEG